MVRSMLICDNAYKLTVSSVHSDIDECAERTDGCAQNCHNDIGNYSCSCNPAFHLNADGHGCSQAPEFIQPTIRQGVCIAIPPNTTFATQLIADSGGSDVSIVEIQTFSPPGTTKGDLLRMSDSSTYYVNITWRPEVDQQNGTIPFCFVAINSEGLSSERNCIPVSYTHLTLPTIYSV